MVKNVKKLTKGTPWRLILSFALPVLFSLLLQQFYNTVDAIIVSNFDSETAFASIGVTTPLTMLFLALANSFSADVGVIVSQLFGAEKT